MKLLQTLALVGFVLALALPGGLRAGDALDATTILASMDKVTSGYADQEMDVDLIIIDVDGSRKTYGMNVRQKGSKKRLVRFTSGETKGMSTLIDGDRMNVYMPGFKKIRRIAQHNMQQAFAGSDFSNEDMALIEWTEWFDVTLVGQDDTTWTLKGTKKPGKKLAYDHVLITVKKDGFFQRGVDYFDAEGKKVKEFRGEEMSDWQGTKRFKVLIMRDPRTGHQTEMHLRSFKVDQGLTDDDFTKRQLRWGR